jgi:ERCC4-type nuclease
MPVFTIVRDNREQKPWSFDSHPVGIEDATISTGDYTVAELCETDHNDTYHPKAAIERKSGSDFASSITYDRERFKKEIKRAGDWPFPLHVIVEEPYITFADDRSFMTNLKLTPSQVKGTIQSWQEHYNVKFTFAGNRGNAQRQAFAEMSSWVRTDAAGGF